MPNWKKVITSGSTAELNQITASGNIKSSGTIAANSYQIGGEGFALYDVGTTTLSIAEDGNITDIQLGKENVLTQRFKITGPTNVMGDITASGNITGSTIEANNITANTIINAPEGVFTDNIEINKTALPKLQLKDGTNDRKLIIQVANSITDFINNDNAAHDVRFKLHGEDNHLYLEAQNNRVGIGDNAPNQKLGIKGTNAQISIEEDDTEFLRLGVGETENDAIIGYHDDNFLRFGVYSSPTDTSIDTHMSIGPTGQITASGVISSSGGFVGDGSGLTNVTATATLPDGVVSGSAQINSLINDTIAATIVGEIDNDEIPIAKLASDAITIGGAGSTTLGGTATVANILKTSTVVSSSAQIDGLGFLKVAGDSVVSSSTQIADVTLTTAAQTNITSVGALNGGSITSGFGAINNGASAITTTGTVSAGRVNTTGGVHVGGTSDPGTDNLIVDGTSILTGNVGIGTTSPQAPLHVIGNISSSGDLIVEQSASIGPNFFNSTYGTDGTLQVKSTTSDSGVPSAIYLEEVDGGEGWRMGVDADGDFNFYNSTSALEVVSFQDSNKVHVKGDISSSTDIYAGNDIFVGDDLFLGHKNALGISETAPSIIFYSGSNGATHQLVRYSTSENVFTIGRNHQAFKNNKVRMTVHNSNGLSSMTIKSGSDNSLVGINNDNPTKALTVTGDISASVSMSAAAFSGDGSGLTNVSATLPSGVVSGSAQIGSLTVAQGGTGATSLADKAVLISQDSSTDAIGTAVMDANGEILVGGTNGPAVESANDLAGTNLSATAGDGTLVLNVDDAFLKNDANDTTSGIITAAGFTTAGDITASGISIDGDIVIPQTGNIYFNGIDGGEYMEANGHQQIDIRVNNQQALVCRPSGRVGIGGYFAGDEALNVDGIASASGFITHGNITASGTIEANATTKTGLDKLVTYDTSTKKFHITASSAFMGGGGSTTPAGSNTQVQFNSGGSMAGDSGLVFNSATNLLTVGKITSDGSNIFGNSTDDTHTFTGNITASGNISASGTAHIIGGNVQVDEFSCLGDAVFGRHLSHQGDSDTKITFETNTISFVAGNTTHMGFTQTGGTQILTNITASGNVNIGTGKLYGSGSYLTIANDTTNPSELRLNCEANSHYIGIRGPVHSGASSYVLKLPNTAPSDNQILKVNGSPSGGEVTLAWEAESGGGGTSFPTTDVISSSTDLVIGNIESNTYISASSGTLEISGSGRGQLEVDYRLFNTGSTHLSAAGGAQGDIVKFGGTSTTAGKIYMYNTNHTWVETQANTVSRSTGSLAVALGANSTTDGMLLRGYTKLANDVSTGAGQPIFLSNNGIGQATGSAPAGSGNVVRVIGYYFGNSGQVYFNPDNTTIVVA